MTTLSRATGQATVGAVALVLALTACSPVSPKDGSPAKPSPSGDSFGAPADAGEVKQGGKLTVALSAEPDRLDPSMSRSLYSRYVFQAMCQKLYDVDAQANVVPQLATALPAVSSGGKSVTIPLRRGVRFADGTAFNSAAVKTTLERDLTLPESARKSELGPIGGIDKPDPQTVVVRLKTPFAPLLGALTDRAGMIMSPAALQRLGTNFSSAPVCVGPFKFANRVRRTRSTSCATRTTTTPPRFTSTRSRGTS